MKGPMGNILTQNQFTHVNKEQLHLCYKWEHRSEQLHFQLTLPKLDTFCLIFLLIATEIGPEQTMKCAEYILLHPLLQ